MSYTISLNVVPIGTSTNPTLTTFPPNANTFVPFEFSVPMFEYQSAPFSIILVIFAYVSTLFIKVGFPHSPSFAGYGGFNLGCPLLPSIDSNKAVSSPQTKAPAPNLISMSKLNSVPNMLLPSSPYCLACFIAISNLCTAIGYSALTYIYPLFAPILYPAIIIASTTECGSPSNILLSINAPGSPSSALHTTYFCFSFATLVSSHFLPVGKPAPPLPLNPEFFTSSITLSGVISNNTFSKALYPSNAMYSSISSGFITPQFFSAILFCFL